MRGARLGERAGASTPGPGVSLSQHLHMLTTQPSGPCTLVFVVELFYTSFTTYTRLINHWTMIDTVIDQCRLNLLPGPTPSSEVRRWELKIPTC